MLSSCLNKGWHPKGLRVHKKLITLCPNSSNIKETFEETLNEATDFLIEQLLDHLTLVAEEAQSEALMDKQRMN